MVSHHRASPDHNVNSTHIMATFGSIVPAYDRELERRAPDRASAPEFDSYARKCLFLR